MVSSISVIVWVFVKWLDSSCSFVLIFGWLWLDFWLSMR